jgi:hypothetical protein
MGDMMSYAYNRRKKNVRRIKQGKETWIPEGVTLEIWSSAEGKTIKGVMITDKMIDKLKKDGFHSILNKGRDKTNAGR